MSTRGWTERVEDILDAIAEVDAFIGGMELETFRSDARTLRAVELNLIIIGEAASRIPDDIQATYSEIPWSFMKAMRNRLVHAYFNVDAQILWDTVVDRTCNVALSQERVLQGQSLLFVPWIRRSN